MESAQYWWIFLLRGMLAVFFAMTAFTWPGLTIVLLILFFGIHCLLDGLFSLFAAWHNDPWWLYLIHAIISTVAGLAAFTWPGLTALTFLTLLGIWAICRGLFEILSAVIFRIDMAHPWLLLSAGVVSFVFGVILWLIAAYAFVFGIFLIGFSFQLRKLRQA